MASTKVPVRRRGTSTGHFPAAPQRRSPPGTGDPVARRTPRTAVRRRRATARIDPRRLAIGTALLAATSLALGIGMHRYSGLFGTWPVSRERVDAEVAAIGARPPVWLAPPGADPYRWLLQADPRLAALVRRRLEDEAALRLIALRLGAAPTPADVGTMERRLRDSAAWQALARSRRWTGAAWRAEAERCAWQEDAIESLATPSAPPPAELESLYRQQYRGAPTAVSFARVRPALVRQADRLHNLLLLQERVQAMRSRLRTIVWDRTLAPADSPKPRSSLAPLGP